MSERDALMRAHLLYNSEHYEQAGAMCLEALKEDPQDAEAQAMLALCLSKQKLWKQAIEAAREAVRLNPEELAAHEALAVIFLNANRLEEAEKAIHDGLSLEPESSTFWILQAHLAVRRSEWPRVLEAAERGLANRPDHSGLLNMRAMALMKLGRVGMAREGLQELLAENPEDPDSLSTMGWAALHAGQHREALEHFQAALRLEPENMFARQGLLESLRSRYPFYGLILKFFLWMSGMSRDAQNAIQTGLYLGQVVLNNLAREHKWLRPWVRPLVFLYAMFAYLTWLARPLTTLMLRLNPYGRLVLTADDVAQSNLVGGLLGATGALAAVHALTGNLLAMVGWAFTLTLCIPVSAIHDCEEGWPRQMMGRTALAMGLLGLLGFTLMALGVRQGLSVMLIYFQLLAPVQFLAMYLTTARPELGHED